MIVLVGMLAAALTVAAVILVLFSRITDPGRQKAKAARAAAYDRHVDDMAKHRSRRMDFGLPATTFRRRD